MARVISKFSANILLTVILYSSQIVYFQYKKAAALFTKNGQVRDAAAMYRSMHNYQAAVDLYINNEQYEEAIDELKLYEFEEKVSEIL